MALPEQIRKQTEAVQELYKQLNGDENNGNEATPPADGNTSPSENTAQPAPADESAVPNNAAQPQGNEQTPSGTGQEDDPNSETYAQKWRTLQGMYNAEVPRLHSQNRELNGRVQQMEQLLASLSQQSSQPAQQTQVQPLVTENDVQEYGESIDVMRRVTREELYPVAQKIAQLDQIIRSLQTSVVPQVQAVAHRQAMTAEQQFWSDLSSAAPNWREINDDHAFQSWLLEIDPLTGISRQTYLEDAQRILDVRRVASFFQTWNELTGKANVAQNTRRTATASELERQVAPGRSKNTGTPANNNAKTYSPDDIKGFFNDVRSGKYRGREAERDRIERDIFAAQRDGRITVNA
jgi:hypothetical protein